MRSSPLLHFFVSPLPLFLRPHPHSPHLLFFSLLSFLTSYSSFLFIPLHFFLTFSSFLCFTLFFFSSFLSYILFFSLPFLHPLLFSSFLSFLSYILFSSFLSTFSSFLSFLHPLLFSSFLSSLSNILSFPSPCAGGKAIGADGEFLTQGGGNGAYSGIRTAIKSGEKEIQTLIYRTIGDLKGCLQR